MQRLDASSKGRKSALNAFVAALVTDRELFPAFPAACTQNIAPVHRRHALAKTMLVATLADGRLKCSLAHDYKFWSLKGRAKIVEVILLHNCVPNLFEAMPRRRKIRRKST
jgi:hypothetical protein